MNISQQLSLFASEGQNGIGAEAEESQPSDQPGDQQLQDQLSNQNTNDLLRPPQQPYEMQNFQEQQGIPQHQQPQQFQQQNPAFGQLNNMLISMLQQSAQAQQGNGQNPFPNAEAILAHILAAANSAGVAGMQFPQGQQQQMGFNANQQPDAQTLQQQLMMNLQQQQQHQGAVGNADNSFQGGQQQQYMVPPQQQQLPLMGQPFNQGVYNNFGAMGSFVSPVDGNAEQPAFQNQDYNAARNGAQGGFGSLGIQFEHQQQQQQVCLPKNKKGAKDPTPLSSMLDEEQAAEQRSRAKAQPKKHPRAKTFPDKLMQGMMENPNEDIVAWLPDGRSFVVVDPDRFCTEIVGKVMKECKYPSFVRKLHRWGFVRLTSGTGTDCFHHPQFIKNKRDLAARIDCGTRGKKEKISKAGSKPPSLAGVEKFIHAKAVAAAASAAASNAVGNLLLNEADDEPGLGVV